jgi:hypothetical protein
MFQFSGEERNREKTGDCGVACARALRIPCKYKNGEWKGLLFLSVSDEDYCDY